MRHGSLPAGVLCAALLPWTATRALAAVPEPGLAACSEAFSAAPDLAKGGKLLAARGQLTQCAAEPCPASMRQLCAQDLRHLEEQIPTVVFVARGPRGEDLLDVRVVEDAKVVVARLDGRTVAVDPGPHRFRFERADGTSIEAAVILNEGEKARPIAVALPAGASTQEPSPPATTQRPWTWPVYVAGGLTAAAAVSFGVFGTWGLIGRSDLSSCKGSCSGGAVDDVSTRFTVADVSLVTGAIALAATVILYLTRPQGKADVSARGFDLAGAF